MGFGHRVYKNYDPRAKLMRETCYEVLEALGLHDDPLFKLAMGLEKIALEDDYFVSRKLYPNVDYYSGIVQKAIGIPIPLFTAIFALARTVGWIAQLNEMIADPEYKIGRPRQLFTGATRRSVKPLARAVIAAARPAAGCRRARYARDALADYEAGTMSTPQEYAIGSTLFGGNAPYIEEQYERYLADPAAVSAEWRGYFDSLRGGAADVAHAPVIESFIQLAKQPQGRRGDGRRVDDAQAGARAADDRPLSHAGHVPRGPRPAAAAGEALPRRSRPRRLRLHRGGHGHRVRRRLVQGGLRADAPLGADPGAEGNLLPQLRRRVHVHQRHGDQAVRPGAPRADPLAADLSRRAAPPHPRAADRRRDARALPAHEIRRPEALLRRGRRDDDPDARSSDPDRGGRGRAGDGDRHGAPRAPQRARRTRWARCPPTCSPSSRASTPRSSSPATSSTTRASRPTSSRRAVRCT